MLALDLHSTFRTLPPMGKAPVAKPMSEQKAIGLALKSLRNRAGLTQEEAAERAGVVVTSWRRYEWGQRDLSLEKAKRLARAVDADEHELLTARARVAGDASGLRRETIATIEPDHPPQRTSRFEVPVWGRVRAGPKTGLVYDVGEPLDHLNLSWLFGPDAGFLRVAGDSETGYVESGQYVIYNRRFWPSRGEGCVIETSSGEMYVKEFIRQEGNKLVVAQRFPEATIEFDLESEVKGVYRVVFRGG